MKKMLRELVQLKIPFKGQNEGHNLQNYQIYPTYHYIFDERELLLRLFETRTLSRKILNKLMEQELEFSMVIGQMISLLFVKLISDQPLG